jgi:hypothetical protein
MAAAIGNQYALGNKGGQPARYKSVDELQQAIDKYFLSCQAYKRDDNGDIVMGVDGEPVTYYHRPLTVTGLALALGFTSRLALLNYQDKNEYVNAVTRAKLIIEDYTATQSFDNKAFQGAKFNLTNNYGWRDTQLVEVSGPGGSPLQVQDVSTLSDGDLERLIEIANKLQIQGEVVDITPLDDNDD